MRFFNLLAGFRECTSLSARYWAEGGAFRDANEQIEKMLFSSIDIVGISFI